MPRVSRNLVFFLAALFIASAAAAEQRQIPPRKQKLIRELLELTAAPEGAADAIIDILGGRLGLPIAPEVARGEAREGEQVEEIAEKTQVYDRYFTEKQLRDLIAFFKTSTGKHYVEVARKMAVETRNNLQAETERRLRETGDKARADRTRNDLQTLGLALSAYFADHSVYPKAQNIQEVAPQLVPKYAPTIPQQDAWGHFFSYEVSADGLHYRVISAGMDGQPANSDDIVLRDGQLQR